MRKIGPDGQLERMICNACGKKLAVRQGIVLEGAISIYSHSTRTGSIFLST